MDCERITASEYLVAEEKAWRNGSDKPAFRLIEQQLQLLPEVQETLVFEFLAIAWDALEREECPGKAAIAAIRMSKSVGRGRLPEYLTCIERIAFRCFELMGRCKDNRFTLTLSGSLINLRVLDNPRFCRVMQSLKEMLHKTEIDRRSSLLALANESTAEIRARIRRLNKQMKLQLEGKRFGQ